MSRAVYHLHIAGPAGAVFRVTDGAARCVGTGMHLLDIDLPQGIYTVSASMGRSVETREVLLDESQSIELSSTMPSFGEQAFAIAPEVLVALGSHPLQPGGQLIALRGPWRDEQTAADRVSLDCDGRAVAALREGLVPDPSGVGVWSWQLFNLDTASRPAVFNVTRSVCTKSSAQTRPSADVATTGSKDSAPQKVSHVLPHWGDWMVWAAYPATACGAPAGVDLPMPYYLRLRLTRVGAAPAAFLQSLSDQVFTALAARSGLPLTKPVLDLLLLPDDIDPLLVLAAAHLASITLASLGRLPQLPHDASASTSQPNGSSSATQNEALMIDTEALHQRFHAWLAKHENGPLANAPDLVAARFLFALSTSAHLRVPPVLLRSLDSLIYVMESPMSRTAGAIFDETVWGPRLQISDSFAFLQWLPDSDYAQELLNNVKRSLENAQAMQSIAGIIEQASAKIARKYVMASASRSKQPELPASMPAMRHLPPGSDFDTTFEQPREPQGLDVEAFIQSNVMSLRIPASAMERLGTVLGSLSIDQDSVGRAMQQLAVRIKND
ncbi:hypothetical protein [Aquabacterium sp. CECT 9606]|uniref:hypothetical protein n=1 Tax=Aquabacterium sp. CECT 9606 TaxID=2845822 RepID=UPI001E5F1168|nr:hypothetical protein [Aquabacterium sp. CECT 9606]CAH0353159.1 hypothetical protein AQB9606_03091 [Aquabacterium sp. CECT 9606]